MWTLVEKKSGTGASAVITFSGLNGDAHKWYRIMGIGEGSSSAVYTLRINGSLTNMNTNGLYDNAGTWAAYSTQAQWHPASSSGVWLDAWIFADASDSFERGIITKSAKHDGTPSENVAAHGWNDTTTNITSLTLNLSAGNWSTDTHFWLYKLANP